MVGWLVVLRINVDLAIFKPYLDLEAGDNQSLKIQVAMPWFEPRSSFSASQELNHSATALQNMIWKTYIIVSINRQMWYFVVFCNLKLTVIAYFSLPKNVQNIHYLS